MYYIFPLTMIPIIFKITYKSFAYIFRDIIIETRLMTSEIKQSIQS